MIKKIVVASSFLLGSYSVNATNLVFDAAGNIIGTYAGTPSKAADWWYATRNVTPASGGGVNVKASGAVTVKGIRVPTSITAGISRAAIVAGAMGCFSGVFAIASCAATAVAVGTALKEAGLGYGPCPDGTSAFICKNRDSVVLPKTVWYMPNSPGSLYDSANAACASATSGGYAGVNNYCYMASGQYAAIGAAASKLKCDAGQLGLSNLCWNPDGTQTKSSAPPGPVLPGEMGPDLDGEMGKKPDLAPKIWGAGADDQGKSPRPESAQAGPDTPVTVDAPSVSGPAVETSTETTPKPDGSTDTKKTTEQTTVTPKTTGATNGTSNTTYNTTTTTTTTITNSNTNVTTTTTNVANNAPTGSTTDAPITDFPDDYNREATQQEILKALDTTGAPEMPDQAKVIADAQTKFDTDMAQLRTDAQNGQSDKSAWFSWVWNPPSGSCTPAVGSVGSTAISWDYCPTVNNIRDVLGWLMALFSGLTIYGQLFKRGD